jgi:MATE family multidrug resistance protein
MFLFATLFFAVPELLARLYSPDEDIVALASTLIRIAAFFELFDGLQAVAGGALRGAADTRVPATLAFVGYWLLGLPLGALLAFRGCLGPQGLWWGLTIGLASVAVLLLARLARRFRGEIAAVE